MEKGDSFTDRASAASRQPSNYTQQQPQSTAFERHLSVKELAEMWGMSRGTIIKLFENEPGVIVFGSDETRFKRGYRNFRIPLSVAENVHKKLRNKVTVN